MDVAEHVFADRHSSASIRLITHFGWGSAALGSSERVRSGDFIGQRLFWGAAGGDRPRAG